MPILALCNNNIDRSACLTYIERPFPTFYARYGIFLGKTPFCSIIILSPDMSNSFMWIKAVTFINTEYFVLSCHNALLLFYFSFDTPLNFSLLLVFRFINLASSAQCSHLLTYV